MKKVELETLEEHIEVGGALMFVACGMWQE